MVMFRLVGICLASLSLVFFGIAALLRLFPQFLRLLRLGLRGFLILSFRLYHLLLTPVAYIFQHFLDIDIFASPIRVIASLLLSMVLGWLFTLLAEVPVVGWEIVLFILHGLFVGLAWDEIGDPAGLQLGVKIE
jgi:hypothetical protein